MADRADNGIRKQDNYGTADCANIIAPDGEYEQMEPLDKAAAVSYTHLDVYKRQHRGFSD